MPNSSRFLIQQPCDSKLRRQAAANRGNIKKKEVGKKTGFWVPYACAAASIHRWPRRFLGTEVRIWGRGEEARGPMWLRPSAAFRGYPSNTDYYVVPPLTLMGCYNDLKWFNGSQVGAPNGPLYTPMRIMNGNDSVVKCLCFFRFLLSFPPHPLYIPLLKAVWQVSFCVAIGLRTAHRMHDGLLREQFVCVLFSLILVNALDNVAGKCSIKRKRNRF